MKKQINENARASVLAHLALSFLGKHKILTASVISLLSVMIGCTSEALGASEVKGAEDAVKFSATTILDYSTNLYEVGNPRHASGNRLWLAPAMKTGDFTLSALAIVSVPHQEVLSTESQMKLTKGVATLRYRTKLNPFFTLSPAAKIEVPVNKNMAERETLQAAPGGAMRLLFNFSKSKTPVLDAISGFNEISLSRRFHRFQTSTTGRSNTQIVLSSWSQLRAAITEKFSLGVDFIYVNQWTYKNVHSSAFDLGQSIWYDFTEQLTVGLEHSNGGSTLAANGVDSNIEIFDENSSTITASAVFGF